MSFPKVEGTYKRSSSKDFTEYRGDVGSLCSTSTWFVLSTKLLRISLFSNDWAARSSVARWERGGGVTKA